MKIADKGSNYSNLLLVYIFNFYINCILKHIVFHANKYFMLKGVLARHKALLYASPSL